MDDVNLYLVHMSIPIIDGKGEERKALQELQKMNLQETMQIAVAVITEIQKRGFTLISDGQQLKLVGMPLEVYQANMREIWKREGRPDAHATTQESPQPQEAKGQGLSE